MKGAFLLLYIFSGFAMLLQNGKTESNNNKVKCCDAFQRSLYDMDDTRRDKTALIDSEVLRCKIEAKLLDNECFKTFSSSYLKLNQVKKFKTLAKEQIKQARKAKSVEELAVAYTTLGNYHKKQSEKDSAYYYYYQGYKDLEAIEPTANPNELGWFLYYMASIQESAKDYTGAERNTIEALKWFSIKEEPKPLFFVYNLLAITQNGLNKFDETLKYHLKAKEVIPEIEDEKKRTIYFLINYNNIASTHLRSNKNKQALEFYNDFLSDESKLRSLLPTTLSRALASRAEVKLRLKSYSEEEIIMDLDKAHDLARDLDSKSILAMVNHYYARTYLAFGKKEIAIDKALLAKELAEESESNDRLLEILQFLAENEFKESSRYAKAYFELNERLIAEERNIQEKFARIQFESDEIEQENAKLSKQKELLAGIAIGLLLLGIGVITIITQRISNEKLRFEKSQQESNQEIYNLMLAQKGKVEEGKKSEQRRISEELHDGILGQMLGIRLILSGLNEREDQEAITQRAELIDKLQELEEEIRLISHELNRESYKKVDNFILALHDLIHTSEKAGNAKVHPNFDVTIDWNMVDGNSKINIYRIIQEAIQNCMKHAKCQNIFVELRKSSQNLYIQIKDDGVGYRTSKTKKGIGLKNIVSRTKKINGSLNVESEVGKGTSVNIEVPMDSTVDKAVVANKTKLTTNYKLQT